MSAARPADLVSRLRARYGSRDHQFYTWGALLEEAADEIERLRMQLRQIDEAERVPHVESEMKVALMAALARQGLHDDVSPPQEKA